MRKKQALKIAVIIILLCCLKGEAACQRQIVINIPAFTLHLYENGIVTKAYPISIGRQLNPSVLGSTTIINIVVDPTYYPPQAAERGLDPIPPGPDNPVGTRWLGLGFASYGIHGTNNPDSIGQAASSGCIRLLNEDVQELAELVPIGTPVELIYQTVLLGEDPLLHTKTITVYPDIYQQNVSEQQLVAELERRGWHDVHWPVLSAILRQASGQPCLLPRAFCVRINGKLSKTQGVQLGTRFYLPCSLPHELITEPLAWGKERFFPLQDYLNMTGLTCSMEGNELVLQSPQAYLDDQHLGKALVYNNAIYIEAASAAFALASEEQLLPIHLAALQFWGDLYLPADFLTAAYPRGKLHLSPPLTD